MSKWLSLLIAVLGFNQGFGKTCQDPEVNTILIDDQEQMTFEKSGLKYIIEKDQFEQLVKEGVVEEVAGMGGSDCKGTGGLK